METKTRAPNFTLNETETLIDLLYARPDLACGKTGKNYMTHSELKQGWEYIADIVNGVGTGYKRSARDVKKKWRDLKFQAKRKASKAIAYRNATGCDPPCDELLTAVEQKIIGLINKSHFNKDIYDNVNQSTFSSENSDNETFENSDDLLEIEYEPVETLKDHLKKNNSEISIIHPTGNARIQAHEDKERMKNDEEKDVLKELIQLNSQVLKHLEKSNNIKYNMLQEMKLSNKLKVTELKIKCKIYNLDLDMINDE